MVGTNNKKWDLQCQSLEIVKQNSAARYLYKTPSAAGVVGCFGFCLQLVSLSKEKDVRRHEECL